MGGASQLLDLIAQDGLQSKLTAAAGKAAFPDAIAELVAQHAKEEKPSAVNPELLAVKASLKEKAPRVKYVSVMLYVSVFACHAVLMACCTTGLALPLV